MLSMGQFAPRERTIAQLLPYWKLYLGALFSNDGSITGGFELQGVSLEGLSEEELAQLRYRLILFLHSLPWGIELQFVYHVRPLSPVLEQFKHATEEATPESCRFLWRNSANYLEEQSNIWHTRLYLFATLPGKKQKGTSLKERYGEAFRAISRRRIMEQGASWSHQRFEQMRHVMETLKASLSLLGIGCRELSEADIRTILYEALNPGRSHQIPYTSGRDDERGVAGRSLRDAVALSGLQRFPREFILDDHIHRVLSLKDIPQRQFLGVMEPLLGLREFPFDITVGIELEDADTILKVFRRARNINANLQSGKRNEEQAAHEEHILQESIERLVQGHDKAFKVAILIHYWGRSEEELHVAEAVLRNAVHQCCEAKEIREEFTYPSIFFASLPGGFKKIKHKRGLDVITPQALALLPIYQHIRGSARPVALLKTRRDELVGLDPFNPKLSASNGIIFGPTGRGKSFLAQFLLLHYFRLNPKMMIVDIGGSYRRLTELIGGTYIALSHASSTALNPFPARRGELDPVTLGELAGIVERMVKDSGQGHIDRVTQYVIRKAIQCLYAQETYPLNFLGLRSCLSTMAVSATDRHDKRTYTELAKRLSLWIEGEGGKLLVSDQLLSLESPVITVDLGGVPPVGDLQAILMQILASLIRYQVAHIHGPKIILFDEVWKHLGDPTAAGILDELYRTARKHFTSVLSISQELDDFLNPVIKTSLVKNSEVRFILNTVEELELLQRVFKLNDNELQLIRSLSMQRGHFSEVFTMIGEEHHVLRLEATPWIYWMCTTHPPELEIERQLQTARPAMAALERIQFLAEKFPRGIATDEFAAAQKLLREGL